MNDLLAYSPALTPPFYNNSNAPFGICNIISEGMRLYIVQHATFNASELYNCCAFANNKPCKQFKADATCAAQNAHQDDMRTEYMIYASLRK